MNAIRPGYIGIVVAAIMMMVLGWGGLYQLITTTIPRLGAEMWLFFVLLQVAVTGTAIPIVLYLNVRFTRTQSSSPNYVVIVRQSMWIGLFVVACAWLRIPRILSLPIASLLVLLFIGIEFVIRTRELRVRE